LRLPDIGTLRHARLKPLLIKELWDILSGRSLWTMLLILCPLVGYSFFQAVALYSEASAAARDSPALASGLSPLDGVLVPTFGALYLSTTLLFPFVAIRTLGHEKESGALQLLVQLPYRVSTLIVTKLAAICTAWLISAIPAISALVIWQLIGGHLYAPESLNLILGQLLYGMLVGAIALFSAAICESSATAAIMTLAFTIGSWVLDFALAGQPGLLQWISHLSLTQTLRSFERGLLSIGLLLGIISAIGVFSALATLWLHPGTAPRTKVMRSLGCVLILAIALAFAMQIGLSIDVAEDRRNSFPVADQRALAEMHDPLIITVHFAPEDPRYVDLRRNVLAKLERVLPDVTVRLATTGQSMVGSTSDEAYGEVEYSYRGRSATSRSTSHREVLPVLYGLAEKPIPTPLPAEDYPGYPLIAGTDPSLLWFFGVLPPVIVIAWLRSRRAPSIPWQPHGGLS
jgi:ABC-2 type transport system permease protein